MGVVYSQSLFVKHSLQTLSSVSHKGLAVVLQSLLSPHSTHSCFVSWQTGVSGVTLQSSLVWHIFVHSWLTVSQINLPSSLSLQLSEVLHSTHSFFVKSQTGLPSTLAQSLSSKQPSLQIRFVSQTFFVSSLQSADVLHSIHTLTLVSQMGFSVGQSSSWTHS